MKQAALLALFENRGRATSMAIGVLVMEEAVIDTLRQNREKLASLGLDGAALVYPADPGLTVYVTRPNLHQDWVAQKLGLDNSGERAGFYVRMEQYESFVPIPLPSEEELSGFDVPAETTIFLDTEGNVGLAVRDSATGLFGSTPNIAIGRMVSDWDTFHAEGSVPPKKNLEDIPTPRPLAQEEAIEVLLGKEVKA